MADPSVDPMVDPLVDTSVDPLLDPLVALELFQNIFDRTLCFNLKLVRTTVDFWQPSPPEFLLPPEIGCQRFGQRPHFRSFF